MAFALKGLPNMRTSFTIVTLMLSTPLALADNLAPLLVAIKPFSRLVSHDGDSLSNRVSTSSCDPGEEDCGEGCAPSGSVVSQPRLVAAIHRVWSVMVPIGA